MTCSLREISLGWWHQGGWGGRNNCHAWWSWALEKIL